ncbi:MAG: hypothetical protein H6863_01620 [Rhodospirillales bacterium]|nr:hypothetical protein [Rhodospirillales bacterium]
MIVSREAFLQAEKRVITLIGMSGVGKTHLSQFLEKKGWECYSCDLAIGTLYLHAEMSKVFGRPAVTTMDNLSDMSNFIGQLGSQAEGGLPLEEFKRRQSLYYMAECRSLEAATESAEKKKNAEDSQNLVIDSTGSLCEIADDSLIESLGRATLFVYLKASADDEREVIQRAQDVPKPLFFPPGQFQNWVQDYLRENDLSSEAVMAPNDFSRWVFPKLLASRLPKYQALADRYGVAIPAAAFSEVETAQDFLEIVARHLKQ